MMQKIKKWLNNWEPIPTQEQINKNLFDKYNKVIKDLEYYKNTEHISLNVGDMEKLLFKIDYIFVIDFGLNFQIKRNNNDFIIQADTREEHFDKIINFIKSDPLYISLWREKQINSILED